MPVPELRREIPSSLSEPSNVITALALKAEAILGYSWLRRKLGIESEPLAQALTVLGIEPFRMEDVRAYKRERARMAEREAIDDYRERSRRDGYVFLPPGTYVQAMWRTVPLNEYDGEVPAFALSHALEIKDRVPSVRFEVDELRVDKRYDPFLIAVCGKQRFYIDVWEEKSFEENFT